MVIASDAGEASEGPHVVASVQVVLDELGEEVGAAVPLANDEDGIDAVDPLGSRPRCFELSVRAPSNARHRGRFPGQLNTGIRIAKLKSHVILLVA